MKFIILTLLISFTLAISTCYAQHRDTLTYLFNINEWKVENIDQITKHHTLNSDTERVTHVIILGDASPDGPDGWNYSLSHLRAEHIKRHIYNEIKATQPSLFECKTQSIFEKDRIVNKSEYQLYRRAVTILISHSTTPIGIYRHTLQSYISIPENIDSLYYYNKQNSKEYNKTPALAIGTNLLYIAMGAPNLHLEYYPKKGNFTISANAAIPWFKQDSKHQYYQIQRYTLATNYYPVHGETWCGWHYGPYIECGLYDLERRAGWFKINRPNYRGYQGESVGCGAIAGYTLYAKRGSNIKVDFTIGIGYIYSKFREYIATDDRYPFQKYGRVNYFGPTHIGISILWDAIFRKQPKQKR